MENQRDYLTTYAHLKDLNILEAKEFIKKNIKNLDAPIYEYMLLEQCEVSF